jgi:hypothetical protein
MFLYSSITLSEPVGSKYIDHMSPPRFKVVDISQLGLSLCLFKIAPFHILLHKNKLELNLILFFVSLWVILSLIKFPLLDLHK